jgi:ribosomal protein L7/L12
MTTKQTISINGTLVSLGEHEQADGDVAFGMFVALSPEDARAIAAAGHLMQRVRVTLQAPESLCSVWLMGMGKATKLHVIKALRAFAVPHLVEAKALVDQLLDGAPAVMVANNVTLHEANKIVIALTDCGALAEALSAVEAKRPESKPASLEVHLMAVAVEYDAGGGRMTFGGKIGAIRQIRMEIPGLALKEAKDLVESAPVYIGTFPADKAERLAANLRQYGATVEVKP